MTLPIAHLVVTSREGAKARLARDHAFTHLVSIGDGNLEEAVEGHGTVPHVLPLFFDDASRWRPGYVMPAEEHIQALLRFGRTLKADSRLLVHCRAGISRSTAAAYIILADRYGSGREAEAMAQVLVARADCWGEPDPNELMLELGDRLLRREGRLTRERTLARLFAAQDPYGSGY